jgi:hypothetical protein
MVRCQACGTRWLARTIADDAFGAADAWRGVAGLPDVVDAVVIEHIGPRTGMPMQSLPPPPPPPPRPARPIARAPLDRRRIRLFGIAVGAMAAFAVLRAPIVAALPEFGGLPADAGQLEFRNVRSETVRVHGVSTLFVEGDIINHSATDVALPAIRIALKSARGTEVDAWVVEPAAGGLAPGRSIGFRSALASPPANASQVTLNLVAREGSAIGLH